MNSGPLSHIIVSGSPLSVNTGANLQFSTGMELQVHGLKEVNDSHFHPVLHPV